ncbi:MAG: SxtJ family membrane protein [Candidatus Omnitrophota bacterium]|nr:SxtJ family membrane protein [Candidatus Omnitrophota bacterium]
MKNSNTEKLKSFGITMGIAFIVISAILFFKHKNFSFTVTVSFLFFLIAFIVPALLNPLYIFWMKLGLVLSWINTRLILFLIFYFIFTPMGLIMKLLRKDLLDRKINKAQQSYWKKKDQNVFGKASYEKQF